MSPHAGKGRPRFAKQCKNLITIRPVQRSMKLENLLAERKHAILKAWLHSISDTYPDQTAEFLEHEVDRFANPVGPTVVQMMEAVFGNFLLHQDEKQVRPSLESLVRLRAIQDLAPSQAVAFLFLLKDVLRKELEKELTEKTMAEQVLTLFSRIDSLALLAFDLYLNCREKLYEIKAHEVTRRYSYLLKRMNYCEEILEEKNKEEINVFKDPGVRGGKR